LIVSENLVPTLCPTCAQNSPGYHKHTQVTPA
jgi:hypothetical protein